MEGSNQIRSGAYLSYLSIALSNIVGLLYTPFLLRMLGQSEYGLYALTISVVGYLTIFDSGLGNALVRNTVHLRGSNQEDKIYSLFGMILVIYSVLSIIVFLLGLLLYNNIDLFFSKTMNADELHKIKIMTLLLVTNVSLTFVLATFTSILTAYERFVFPRILNIIRIILQPCVMIPLLLMEYKSVTLVVVVCTFNILTLLLHVWYCFQKLKIKIYFRNFDKLVLKGILGFSSFIFLKLILDKIYWSSGEFITGALLGAVAVSVYSIAIQMKTYYGSFMYTLTPLFLPKFSKLVLEEDSMRKISEQFIKVGRIQFMIASLVLSGFILFGKSFIMLWAGESYIQSYFVALIIIIPQTIPLIQTLGHPLFQAQNRQQYQTLIYFIAAILSILLSIIFTKQWGIYGCAMGIAIATLVCEVIIMNIYYLKIGLLIKLFWKNILSILPVTLIVFIVGFLLNYIFPQHNIFILIMKICLYSLIYLLAIYLKVLNSFEKAELSRLVTKLKFYR